MLKCGNGNGSDCDEHLSENIFRAFRSSILNAFMFVSGVRNAKYEKDDRVAYIGHKIVANGKYVEAAKVKIYSKSRTRHRFADSVQVGRVYSTNARYLHRQ